VPVYTVDPVHFHAEGAYVDWNVQAKRLGVPVDPNHPYQGVIELRWILSADFGLPTEPFQVWVRQHSPQAGFQALAFSQQNLWFAGNLVLISWPGGHMSSVQLDVQAPAGGTAFGFSGGPLAGNTVAITPIPVGNTTIQVTAKFIDCITVTPGVTVTAVRGLPVGGYANTPGWTLVELVGLPVTLARWGGIGQHGTPQGITGALTDAPTAAIARLKRGAPPFGWGPLIAPGVPAPAWTAPDFNLLVGEVNTSLLNFLHDIAKNSPPNQQAAQTVDVPLPPPENAVTGQQVNKPGTTTQMLPLPMTYMAVSTDPFLNLGLGFGTAYPYTPDVTGIPTNDFMITAHWERGFDGVSGPQDYAAIVALPGAVVPPPAPANMGTQILGALRPLNTDGNWRDSVRVLWDRPPDTQLFRIAGIAAARASISPAQPVVALIDTRPSGGFRPISINTPVDPPDPEWWRFHVMDREVEIPSNPGTRQIKYGAAVVDLYGVWTPWSAVDCVIAQPDLDAVRITHATLVPVAPSSGSVCATTLELDFLWDWRIRTPKQITFVGRMYAATTHGDPPPSVVIPPGLDRSLGGGGAALVVTFAGDTPSAPGTTILPLTEDGNNQAAGFGPAQGSSRRYRMTLRGLALDFGSTPFIGMALWTQGQEVIAPSRLSPWPDHPVVTSTGDPRPPVVPIYHVTLGSIPDATGPSHVQISWTPQPNATGYFIYEATEASLLDAWGLPEPQQKDTLDARLLVLRNNFKANPVRRPFTRYNATALTTTGQDIALPKGSTGIHVFVVLGISAGQVESAWPSGPSPELSLIVVAAPHITRPAPPTIEIQQFLDTSAMPSVYKARVAIATRPGPRPAMVEVYRVRVDDAAKELDTMGPPIARLKASAGPWTVNSVTDPDYGSYITTAQGVDAPSGSWRRVWYRATAWTGEDDTRGGLPGRSEASNAAWVVLPPPDAPSISALSLGGGPGPADILIEWTCASPLKKTPLGPHLISVRAFVPGSPPTTLASGLLVSDTSLTVKTGDGANFPTPSANPMRLTLTSNATKQTELVDCAARSGDTFTVTRGVGGTTALAFSAADAVTLAPLISLDTTLDAVDHAQPVAGSGIWITGTSGGVTTYRALIRRAEVTDAVNFAVRITDPLGRTGAQLLSVASGPANPPPDLANVKLQKVAVPAPGRWVLTFTSTSSVKAPLNGPYVLQITGVPVIPVLFPPPLSISMPLGSVPTRVASPPPASFLLRSGVNYELVTPVANLKGFVVRITGPDRKFVEKAV
jgi:hypothetical protein